MTVRTAAEIPVAQINVVQWEGAGPAVVCLAGVGSSGWAFSKLAADLGDRHVVAPSLRGRGASWDVQGPTGLRAHARDVAAVLAELDLTDVVLVGHSMGAFLAPMVAQEAPGRIARIVLIDGGVPPKLAWFFKPWLVRRSFKAKVGRLDREWPDAEALVRKYAGKVLATRPDTLPWIVEIFDREMTGEPGRRLLIGADHVAADAVDCFFNPEVTQALVELTVPAQLFTATGGDHDKAKAFLAEDRVQEWVARKPELSAQRLPGNHMTVLWSAEVLAAVAG